MTTTAPQQDAVFRITALWAFAECALGGVMHALKLPFTGFLVGGFSVLCIGLLAYISQRNLMVILRATLLVLLVKAIVSPQSTPTAYLAVSFQGIIGAFILCYLRPPLLAACLFGFLALVESAFQKIIVLWVFFGTPLFEAVDIFFHDILKGFGVESDVSGAKLLAYSYVILYAIWGLVLGYFIHRLPALMDAKRAIYTQIPLAEAAEPTPTTRRKRSWLFPLLVLIFVAATFLLTGGKTVGVLKALYAVLRSVAVLFAWFYVLQPLVTWLFLRWASRQSEAQKGSLAQIMATLPELRATARSLYQYVGKEYRGWKRFREFVVALFVVAIYRES